MAELRDPYDQILLSLTELRISLDDCENPLPPSLREKITSEAMELIASVTRKLVLKPKPTESKPHEPLDGIPRPH